MNEPIIILLKIIFSSSTPLSSHCFLFCFNSDIKAVVPSGRRQLKIWLDFIWNKEGTQLRVLSKQGRAIGSVGTDELLR